MGGVARIDRSGNFEWTAFISTNRSIYGRINNSNRAIIRVIIEDACGGSPPPSWESSNCGSICKSSADICEWWQAHGSIAPQHPMGGRAKVRNVS